MGLLKLWFGIKARDPVVQLEKDLNILRRGNKCRYNHCFLPEIEFWKCSSGYFVLAFVITCTLTMANIFLTK